VVSFSYWSIKPWFLTKGKLTDVLIIPSSWDFPTGPMRHQGVSLEEVPIVKEYPGVFPDELPGMPPDRDVEFLIDLLPGTGPIERDPTPCPLMS
jgi:hypothetical protein